MKNFVLFSLFISVVVAKQKLETVYEWKYLDYLWLSPQHKEAAIKSGDYDYTNIVPIDVDKSKDGRVFISSIRNNGVPASLATVTDQTGSSGPLLKPYPDWTWYKKGDCNGITSVYRVTIDECNRLYVLDTGYVGSDFVCPAQVLIFELETDRLIKRIRIPDSVSKNAKCVGKLVTPVLEVMKDSCTCELKNLFMADVNGRGLVIYNNQRGSFRLEADVFNPEPFNSNVTIAGQSFDLEDSLMGMAVAPLDHAKNYLIFRPFSSKTLHAASTWDLSRGVSGNDIKYKSNYHMLPSQATAMGVTSDGVLLFGLTREMAIGCWNRRTPMDKFNVGITARDEHRLQFISGLKVLPCSRTGTDEEVWLFSNRLQKIMTGTMNFEEINFRVLKGSVDTLLLGTKCEINNATE